MLRTTSSWPGASSSATNAITAPVAASVPHESGSTMSAISTICTFRMVLSFISITPSPLGHVSTQPWICTLYTAAFRLASHARFSRSRASCAALGYKPVPRATPRISPRRMVSPALRRRPLPLPSSVNGSAFGTPHNHDINSSSAVSLSGSYRFHSESLVCTHGCSLPAQTRRPIHASAR